MSATQSVSIDFLGNAGGLISAINSSVSAMGRMEAQSKTMSASIMSSVRSALAPIAAAVGGAFAAKKALEDFAASDLPGAKAFSKTTKAMNTALKTLSEVIGEYLAPWATKLAEAITYIAKSLEPLIRIVSAFVSSSGDFFQALGSNILGAFRTLMPTVFGFVDKIIAMFSGKADWETTFAKIRAAWNKTWDAILTFMAPIIAALAQTIETVVGLLPEFKAGLPGGVELDWLIKIADTIQGALLHAILAVQFAITNWRLSFDIAKSAALIAVEVVKSTFAQLAGYLPELFKVMGRNIIIIFQDVWNAVVVSFKSRFFAIAAVMSNPWQSIKHPLMAGSVLEGALTAGISPNFSPLQPLPGLPGRKVSGDEATQRTALSSFIATLNTQFGPEVASALEKAMGAAGVFAAAIRKGLPNVNADVQPRIGPTTTSGVGALMFGTAEAFKKENNGKDPIRELTAEQLKVQKDILSEEQKRNQNVKIPMRVKI